ncbi:MAG: hypothetical protein OHK0046_14420 [Anaerolineae bacterium]
MRNGLFYLLLLCFSLAAGVRVSAQQTTLPPPVIVSFEAERSPEDAPLTVNTVESGEIALTLSWQVINAAEDNYYLELSTYRVSEWEEITNEQDGEWPMAGTRTLDLQHPLTFAVPSYRLRLIQTDTGRVLDERVLSIPYDPAAVDAPAPEIVSFTVLDDSVAASALVAGRARVPVSWQVTNRLPLSNLVFEQLLEDGSAVPVELPRDSLWVSSSGEGVVAPVLPQEGSQILLRLRVVNVVTAETYDSLVQPLTVSGEPEVPPTIPPQIDDDDVTPEDPVPVNNCPAPLDVPIVGETGDGCNAAVDTETGERVFIRTFGASTDRAAPNDTLTLNWDVDGADTVLVEMYHLAEVRASEATTPATAYAVFTDLAAEGVLSVRIPEALTQGARFVLWGTRVDAEAVSPAPNTRRVAYAIVDVVPQEDPDPENTVNQVQAAYQVYERGFMLWFAEGGDIWAFSNDGALAIYSLASYAGLPENPVTEEVPPNRVKPASGFGRVWGSDPALRENLGWALGAEQSYTATIESTPPMLGVINFTITLPDGTIVRARSSGTWER